MPKQQPIFSEFKLACQNFHHLRALLAADEQERRAGLAMEAKIGDMASRRRESGGRSCLRRARSQMQTGRWRPQVGEAGRCGAKCGLTMTIIAGGGPRRDPAPVATRGREIRRHTGLNPVLAHRRYVRRRV